MPGVDTTRISDLSTVDEERPSFYVQAFIEAKCAVSFRVDLYVKPSADVGVKRHIKFGDCSGKHTHLWLAAFTSWGSQGFIVNSVVMNFPQVEQ